MMPKRASTLLRLSSHNSVQPAKLATDAIATPTVAALLDHQDPQVHPVKLALPVKEESPDIPDAMETAHQSLFRPMDAVCAPLDHTAHPAHLDHPEPTAKLERPEIQEAMELPETLEPLEALDLLEMLDPLDPLDLPDQMDRPAPPADLDPLDPKAHLDHPDPLDRPEIQDQMPKAVLDPKVHPDPLALLVPMDTLDPLDHLVLLALLDPTPSIVLAPAKESEVKCGLKSEFGLKSLEFGLKSEFILKWRRGCLGDAFGLRASGFSHSPLFFLFFLFSIGRMEKIVV
jgi:hypothetical protein